MEEIKKLQNTLNLGLNYFNEKDEQKDCIFKNLSFDFDKKGIITSHYNEYNYEYHTELRLTGYFPYKYIYYKDWNEIRLILISIYKPNDGNKLSILPNEILYMILEYCSKRKIEVDLKEKKYIDRDDYDYDPLSKILPFLAQK